MFKWAAGPWFDGMFTQSNLGIVTRMTIYVAPRPPHFVTERSAFMTIALVYHREVAGDDECALACERDIVRKVMERGYTLGRLSTYQSSHNCLDGPSPTARPDNSETLNTPWRRCFACAAGVAGHAGARQGRPRSLARPGARPLRGVCRLPLSALLML
jgi:hypothetical protein